MKRQVRSALSRSFRGSFAGACLAASGFAGVAALTASVAEARDYGYGDPYYSPRSYFPSGSGYFYSARPPNRLSDEGYETPRVDRLKAQTAEKLRKAPVPPPTKGPLMVVVSIAQQKLTVYDGGVPFLHSKVSTGMAGHLTPTGVFSIIQKSRWHRSNLYSDAPMPFMQRITWSGIALHAGVLPGHPASHGCIRLPEAVAIRMWRTTQMGARVVVVQNDVSPVEIAHPVLFTRKSTTIVVPPPVAQALPLIGLRPTVDAAKADAAAGPGATAQLATDKTGTTQIKVADISILRGPQGAGQVMTTNDQQAGVPANAESTDAKVASDKAAISAVPAPVVANRAVSSTASSPEMPVARDAPVLAAPEPTPWPILAQDQIVSAPETAVPPPPPVAVEKPLRRGPISVLISRKEHRLYVRKGFAPVFDTPVTIRDRDRPIGTHVFTALALESDGETMRWNVLSVGAAQVHRERRAEMEMNQALRKRDRNKGNMSDAVALPQSPVAAKEALDRLEIPADVVARISELMSVGASLIITDEGLGPETGQETDFVVLTHEHGAVEAQRKRTRL